MAEQRSQEMMLRLDCGTGVVTESLETVDEMFEHAERVLDAHIDLDYEEVAEQIEAHLESNFPEVSDVVIAYVTDSVLDEEFSA